MLFEMIHESKTELLGKLSTRYDIFWSIIIKNTLGYDIIHQFCQNYGRIFIGESYYSYCVVPENIHTPPTEDTLICTPHPPGFSIPRGSLITPPPPRNFQNF